MLAADAVLRGRIAENLGRFERRPLPQGALRLAAVAL
jgi:hypothetical protein